ncbi:MAG: DUF4998 domain-containing protein [Marinifilaceae bacterium]
MKHYKQIINTAWQLIIVLCCFSCTGMNDPHQKYLDEGETIYAARPDSVKFRAGHNRGMIDIYYSAQRIEECVVTWNLGKDSVNFKLPSGQQTYSFEVEESPEGEYVFSLVTKDKYGNVGLPYEFMGNVYGDSYQSSLINCNVETAAFSEGDYVINWKETEFLAGFDITYINTSDNEVKIQVRSSELTTTLPDVKPDSEITYVTYFYPEDNAIDIIPTPYTKIIIAE